MVTISQAAQDLLDKRPFLQEAISQKIVSFSRLADNIKPEIESEMGKNIRHSAVVMAIRRYAKKLEKKHHMRSFNYFTETILKTDICYILIEGSPTALNKIQSLYSTIVFKPGKIFNIVHGNYEIGIITSQSNKEEILNELSDENILRVIEDLVVVSLTCSQDNLLAPGVIYNVLRYVAWENINVLSVTLTSQELNVVVPRNEAMRAYNMLEKLLKTSKNNQEETEELVC
jgi:aspartokinase